MKETQRNDIKGLTSMHTRTALNYTKKQKEKKDQKTGGHRTYSKERKLLKSHTHNSAFWLQSLSAVMLFNNKFTLKSINHPTHVRARPSKFIFSGFIFFFFFSFHLIFFTKKNLVFFFFNKIILFVCISLNIIHLPQCVIFEVLPRK